MSKQPRQQHRNSTPHDHVVERSVLDIQQEMLDDAALMAEKKLESIRSPITSDELLVAMNARKLKNSNPHNAVRATNAKRRSDVAEMLSKIDDEKLRTRTLTAAAQAALILGQTPAQVSAIYGIELNTINQWRDVMEANKSISRRDRLQDMLMVFIEQELQSLLAISIVTSREEWILLQTAADLSSFIAVKTDRVMMMLAAFGRAEETKRRYVEKLEVINQDAS